MRIDTPELNEADKRKRRVLIRLGHNNIKLKQQMAVAEKFMADLELSLIVSPGFVPRDIVTRIRGVRAEIKMIEEGN